MHCCIGAPSDPYVPLVAAYGSSKPRRAFQAWRGASCAFDALKILPRSRRTCSSCTGHTIVSQSRGLSSGPFAPRAAIATSKAKAVIASNLPFGSGGFGAFSFKGSLATRRPAFAAGHQARYPASYTRTHRREGPMCNVFPLSCCLSATGIRFLGVLFPPRDSASLTVGLPPRQGAMDLTGLPRSTRMRYDRVGCQLYPGSSGVHTTVDPSSVAACRFSTARSSSSPPARPDLESCRNEASPLVHSGSPFRSSPHL
jgi:hypothetical protein